MSVLQQSFIAGLSIGSVVVIVVVIIADAFGLDGDDLKLVVFMLSLGLTTWASYQSRDALKTANVVAAFLAVHAFAFIFVPAVFRMLHRLALSENNKA